MAETVFHLNPKQEKAIGEIKQKVHNIYNTDPEKYVVVGLKDGSAIVLWYDTEVFRCVIGSDGNIKER